MQTTQPQSAQMQSNPVVAPAPPPQQPMSAPSPAPMVQHTQYAPQQQQPPAPQQQQPQTQTQPQHQSPQFQQQHQPNQQQQQQQQQPSGAQYQQVAPVIQQTAQPQNPPPPQNAGQPQQHVPHQGLNGGWQSDRDYQERRKMIAKIVHLLQQRKPNAPQEWLKKLPQMAKRLEESLYRSAKSFQEYNDASTLKQRLQQLAVNIGMKTKKMQQAQLAQQKGQVQQPQQQGQPQQAQPQVQQQQQQPNQQQAPIPSQPLPARPPSQPMQQLHAIPQQPQANQQGSQRIVNVAEINPIMSGQPQQIMQQVPASVPAPAPLQAPVQQAPAPIPIQFQQQNAVSQVPAPAPIPNAGIPPQPNGPTGGAPRQVSDRQQVLRHQQQRLLLLRHAAKCQHEDGRCPVTPHCAGMKRLWKHIAECKDQKCLVPHCVSSRYVLSHYHRCKDVRCPVCGPVREAIHRSHEKQKQMQALKQRHQQAVEQNQTQPGALPAPGIAPNGIAVPGPAPISGEQPNKRQRVGSPGHPVAVPSFVQPVDATSQIIQPQPLQHSAAVGQPVIKAGYVYSNPPATGVGVPGRPQVASTPGIAFSNGQVIMPKHTGPKPQEDHTLINCFTIEQIELHIASLNNGLQLSPQKLKTKCLDVLRVLQSHQHGWVFNSPVDPIELGLPDYFEVINNPMDLGTIRKRLENGCYHTLEDFEGHVHLTFDNAMLYNPEGSVVYNMAKEMKAKFEQDYEVLIKQLNAEEDVKRRNGEACLLCGCEKLLFEPPVFYCNGFNCPSKRIRRNSYYYVGGNNQYHWCHQCFQDLRDGKSIELGDMTIRKEELTKKKNDELHEESWVQCDRCERWIHQICALFNTRQNKDQRSEYACPRCTIEERRQKGQKEAISTTPMAEDLQRTKLSEHLEDHVRKKMDQHLKEMSKQKAAADQISMEEADKATQMGGEITIRQVTSMDKKLEVRERMRRRYAFKNYPDEFSFRCKCIVVFQNLDGVDVILFGLYVYEHDEKNPPPNSRCVYISYLDSVHFMRPRQMRTFIYHEILISYLDYVRQRGFSTAHIWACPPLKGDDYILYAKPEDQKTPKDDRLRQWYLDMLVESQKRGIVGKVTNMYDLYFSNEANDATVVPYMDGDYFPAEVENIIKDIEEGKTSKKSGSQGQKKKKSSSNNNKSKQKKKTGRGGTRSTGIDEDALKASGIVPLGKDQKSLEEGGRDFVMVKLGETIQPMKESFIVAYLAWDGADPENMVVPKSIQEHREKYGVEVVWTPKKPDIGDKSNPTENSNGTSAIKAEGEDATFSTPSDSSQTDPKSTAIVLHKGTDIVAVKTENGSEAEPGGALDNGNNGARSSSGPTPAFAPSSGTNPNASAPSSTNPNSSQNSVGSGMSMTERKGKFAAMARKRGRDEPVADEGASDQDKASSDKQPVSTTIKDSKGRMVKVIDDDAEEMDCEFLNNRQAFLNLCQGNHYQFDQLRRAKHSSMMVLWHLHNRDAPKFVSQCATCSREILTGYRFNCPTCADFDQCQECVSNPNTPRHPHQLKPIAVATGQQSELTDAQRKERQRSIQLHMTLLQHAATCNSSKCPSANCTKMKGLLKHGAQCQIKATGGCNVCKRIWALLQIHARQCKASSCPVPNCMAIRERVRQLKKQQQAMDDRRRQEMNRAYRGAR